MSTIAPPYSRREAPSDPGALKGYLDQETQNIQRGIAAAYQGATILRPTGNDDTKRIQSAIQTGRTVFLVDGAYTLSDDILGASNAQVWFEGPGVSVRQITVNKGGFKAVQKTNWWVHLNGGMLDGPGFWSNTWTGIGGNNERGFQLWGCTHSGMTLGRLRNWGLAGVVILGGSHITLVAPDVEGTNLLGTALHFLDSYQFGYLVMHDTVYGAYDDVKLLNPVASQCNFGINTVMNVASSGTLLIQAPHFYDIIGQHGAYLGCSNISMPNAQIQRCGIDGVKFFSGVINEQIENIRVTDFEISDCPNGQAIECGVSGTGYVRNSYASGIAKNCARAITYDGDVRRTNCNVQSQGATQRALYVAQSLGAIGPTDCTWEITSDTSVDRGALINAPQSDRNILRWKGNRCGPNAMVDVVAATGLTIERLDCFDDAGQMTQGLNVAAGQNVKLDCTPIIKGYTINAIKSLGNLTWNASGQDFTSDTTAFFDTADGILPLTSLRISNQSVSATPVVLWKQTLADTSAYTVELILQGKLSTSVDQGMFSSKVMAMRNGGGAVIPAVAGNPTSVSVPSAGFLGVFAWGTSGNAITLSVNSGAAATTANWTGTIKVTRQT